MSIDVKDPLDKGQHLAAQLQKALRVGTAPEGTFAGILGIDSGGRMIRQRGEPLLKAELAAAVADLPGDQAQASAIAALQAAQVSTRLTYRTWAGLAAVTGAVGQGAEVATDTGGHVDPVSGSTIPNDAGLYIWSASPVGWTWISQAAYAALAARTAALDGDELTFGILDRHQASSFVDGIRDGAVGQAMGVRPDGGVAMPKRWVNLPRDRDLAPTLVDLLADVSGKFSLAIDPVSGHLHLAPTISKIPAERDEIERWVTLHQDRESRQVLSLGHDGRLVVPVEHGRSSLLSFIPILTDLDGNVCLAVNRSNGRLIFSPDESSITNYLAPAILRGNARAFNLRKDAIWTYATVQDRDLYVCDVKQKATGTSNAAVPVEAEPMHVVTASGQSNEGNTSGEAGGALTVPVPWDHHVFSLQGLPSLPGSADYTGQAVAPQDIAPLVQSPLYGPSPIAMFGIAKRALDVDFGRRSPGYMLWNQWDGGQPIENFFPGAGHYNYENFRAGLINAFNRAGAYRDVVYKAFFWTQGESYTPGYGDYLEDYIDSVLPLFADAIGQGLPQFILQQINNQTDSTTASGVELDQLAIARARLGAGVTMAGPMYQYPLHDVIHASNVGRMMAGEIKALAYDYAVQQGIAFHPLWPTAGAVTRSGATITVPLQMPAGATSLAIDDDWVLPVPGAGKGFVFTYNGSPVTINAVAIAGNAVQLTLASNPGAHATEVLEYARINHTGDVGWAAGRGQIYAKTKIASPFYRLGYAVPPTLRHYCTRFKETLA